MNDNKLKVTFVMPEQMNQEMREKIFKEGYGMRGKSTWVMEAVEMLLELDEYVDHVNDSDEMQGLDKVETVVITRELKKLLDEAVIDIRKKYPFLEGLQSRIFRTAILHRLLRT